MRFSRRSEADPEKNVLAQAADEARVRDQRLVDLTESNPTQLGIPYATEAIERAIAGAAATAYEPDPLGLRPARRAVADLWRERGRDVSPDDIVITASTSEAYSYLFKLLCDAGDAVLVPQPSYPLFEHLARYEAVEPSYYHLAYDGAWHVDVWSLRDAQSPRAKAVLSVSPNNPTGSFASSDDLTLLASLDRPIVSDEVFSTYTLDESQTSFSSALDCEGPLVFVLDGLSKLAGLPQMKLSWITVGGPERERREAVRRLEHLADGYLSPSPIAQRALQDLLRSRHVAHDAIVERTRRNFAALRKTAIGTAVTVLDAQGGWCAVLRLPALRSEERWVVGLVEDASVVVQPGWFYDFSESPTVVVSLLTPTDAFDEGVTRLFDYVADAD